MSNSISRLNKGPPNGDPQPISHNPRKTVPVLEGPRNLKGKPRLPAGLVSFECRAALSFSISSPELPGVHDAPGDASDQRMSVLPRMGGPEPRTYAALWVGVAKESLNPQVSRLFS